MLSREQQRELLGLALLALGLFLGLALVPTGTPATGGSFPAGNMMGSVGAAVAELVVSGTGVAAAVIPLLVLLAGLRLLGWPSRGAAIRSAVLLAGILVLLPLALRVFEVSPRWYGRLGAAAGDPLVAALGRVGTGLVAAAAFLALSVATLGWNPLRTGARAGTGLARLVAGTGRSLAGAWRGIASGVATLRERRGGRKAPGGGGAPSAAPEEAAGAAATSAGEAGAAPGEAGAPGLPAGAGAPEGAGWKPAEEPAGGGDGAAVGVPPPDLFTPPPRKGRSDLEGELDRLGEILIEKLATFGVEAEMAGRTTGPVVTQFEVVPAPGVKVNKIANLDADLALAMKAQSIRIVAPIPGKGAVGVEIPNPEPEVVYLRDVLESPAYRSSRAELPVILGRDLTGTPKVSDLTNMPHLLIAGATGSGKSVCLNTIITSLVCRHTPETLRMILFDPKMVELSAYVDLPHLRHPVVTDPRDAAGALKWAVLEMERRYELLSENGVRSIVDFNRRVREGKPLRRVDPRGPEGDPDRWVYQEGVLPYVVIVVDELADLMMSVQSEIEKPLAQLAQKARAIGVHLVIATQRPSVNVITGLIKANFPCRIAFRVSSKVDSRTVLDENGAEALLGNGDMLFLPPGESEPVRIQGAFTPDEDTERLMAWYREEAAEAAEEPVPADEESILEVVRQHEEEEVLADALAPTPPEERDELFRAAAEICVRHEQGSTSLLQRRLSIGYGRAARIVDQLHEAGILGPPDGTKPREVLAGLDDLDDID